LEERRKAVETNQGMTMKSVIGIEGDAEAEPLH
jgi:hypothetical protein